MPHGGDKVELLAGRLIVAYGFNRENGLGHVP